MGPSARYADPRTVGISAIGPVGFFKVMSAQTVYATT
jgi:hypothetical protein